MAEARRAACNHDADNMLACSLCVGERFQHERLFQKVLTENDIRESSRVYVGAQSAQRLCPEAFLPADANQNYTANLPFCDYAFNPLPMTFRRTGNRSYLSGGWGEFLRTRELRAGSVIAVDEYRSNEGLAHRFFMVHSTKIFGAFFR